MNTTKKSKTFILDTSAILSGKPINFDNVNLVTTQGVSDELKPGGRDYQQLQFLIEKGLTIRLPSKDSINYIKKTSTETGDIGRLSKTDIEVLALAYEIKKEEDEEPVILTDDYSIQNIADYLNIGYMSISQTGITKRFKWTYRCRGCGKKFKDNISICPICGADTKKIISSKKDFNKT
jgi:UPF0271 protein